MLTFPSGTGLGVQKCYFKEDINAKVPVFLLGPDWGQCSVTGLCYSTKLGMAVCLLICSSLCPLGAGQENSLSCCVLELVLSSKNKFSFYLLLCCQVLKSRKQGVHLHSLLIRRENPLEVIPAWRIQRISLGLASMFNNSAAISSHPVQKVNGKWICIYISLF